MADYLVQDTTMQGIANAVRNMRHEKGEMTPAQIEAKIKASVMGIPVTASNHINPETGKWERPADWPDIDALADQIVGDQDCVYLTYDLRKTPGYGWIGLYAKTVDSSVWTVERGHISDDTFVADYTVSINSGAKFQESLDDTYGNVQIWRVTATGHINRFAFVSDNDTSISFACQYQPCVQRAGKLPWLQTIDINVGRGGNSTFRNAWTEREALIFGKNAVITTLANCWANSFSLQSLDFSGFDTSNWTVTSLNSTFQNCNSLQEINMSSWDTSNWAVTNIASCFDSCYSLRNLDLSGWNTSNWIITTMQRCWFNCYSLQTINTTGWNTSNWAVTTLEQTWNNCYSLQNLDYSNWNTSNWTVTTMNSTWYFCNSLVSLNLRYFNTSNWRVTNMSNCFGYCYSLRSIDTTGWDTSKWAVTNLANLCYSNYSLLSIDFSGWDTSNWNVSSVNNLFPNCFSLRQIKGMSSWQWLAALSVSSVNPNNYLLEENDGIPISVNHNYNYPEKLTPQSLINILTVLPTVTSTKTITLGVHNKRKLTDEQIAIATNKGWTVA